VKDGPTNRRFGALHTEEPEKLGARSYSRAGKRVAAMAWKTWVFFFHTCREFVLIFNHAAHVKFPGVQFCKIVSRADRQMEGSCTKSEEVVEAMVNQPVTAIRTPFRVRKRIPSTKLELGARPKDLGIKEGVPRSPTGKKTTSTLRSTGAVWSIR